MSLLQRRGAVAIATATVLLTTVAASLDATASSTPVSVTVSTAVVNEPFTGDSAPGWVLANTPAGLDNEACLTNGTSGGTPIPGCGETAGPVAGLQLTTANTGREGGATYAHSIASTSALDVTFDATQYGADGLAADGVTMFLAATDPSADPAPAVTLGPNGGLLAYASGAGFSSGYSGLSNGYLGIGFDVYGNFGSSNADGTGCTTAGGAFAPQTVTVRGPGNAGAGYCELSSTPAGGTLNDEVGDPTTGVPVEVLVNPTSDQITSASGLVANAHTYALAFTSVGGAQQQVSGALPSMAGLVGDSSWLDGNGVPKNFTVGFSAATGSSTDVHTVSNAVVTAINPTPPTLTVALSDDSSGTLHNGDVVTYTASAGVTAADETKPITLTDTFPASLQLQTGGVTAGSGWDCSASSGQTVSCTFAGPVTKGTTLPDVFMPVIVTLPLASPAGTISDTATVSSADAVPSSASDTDTENSAATADSLAFTNQPIDTPVNAAMVNTDNTTRHVTVAAQSGGVTDSSYDGTVTLAFQNNPNNAKFVVGGNPVATLTANAVNGVADFSPIVINTAGFGYTLVATASSLTSAVSDAFDVVGAQAQCPAGQTCQTNTSSPTTGQTVLIQAQTGTNQTTITATYGGNVAPLHGCRTSAAGILTFSGDRPKILTLTIAANQVPRAPILLFCYGQPTPFIDVLLHNSRFFSTANQEYEGYLPACLLLKVLRKQGPCIQSLKWSHGKPEVVTIQSSTADPHLTH